MEKIPKTYKQFLKRSKHTDALWKTYEQFTEVDLKRRKQKIKNSKHRKPQEKYEKVVQTLSRDLETYCTQSKINLMKKTIE